jgi:predicted phage-related endonuclease
MVMIPANRFIASKDMDESAWLAARREGVTATQVAKAATTAGFAEAVQMYWDTAGIPDNPYMAFGRDAEGWISLELKKSHEIMPNAWLIKSDKGPYLATPDGLSLDHTQISEIKTTGKDWGGKIPIGYMRQVQWQLFVTGAESCVFAWVLRTEVDGVMVPAWFEPKTLIIERDEDMIQKLIEVADRLYVAVNEGVE